MASMLVMIKVTIDNEPTTCNISDIIFSFYVRYCPPCGLTVSWPKGDSVLPPPAAKLDRVNFNCVC
jgi:hypothetical protein